MERAGNKEGLRERLSHGAPLAAIVVVLLAAALLVAYQALAVLKLIALAMLLALVFRTVVNGLKSFKLPTWLAAIVLVAGIGALGALVWFVVIPNLVNEAQALINSGGPGSLRSLADLLNGLPGISDVTQPLQQLAGYIRQAIGSLTSLARTALSVILGVVAVVFLAIYLAVSPETYVSGTLKLVPVERRNGVEKFIERLGAKLRGWLVGTIVVSIFVGAGAGVGLWIIGVPLALTFGLIAGVLNVIPYLGSIVGGLLPAIVALTVSPTAAILVVVLFLILNQVEGNILRPVIMGNQIEIPPAIVLASILLLGSLLGVVIGALLAVPAAVVAKVLVDEMTEKNPELGDVEEQEQVVSAEESEPAKEKKPAK